MAKRQAASGNAERKKTTRRAASQLDPVTLVMQLMAIPGPSGEEAAVANFIIDQLRAAGIDDGQWQFDMAHRKTPIDGKTGNLCLKLPGTHRGPRRLLMAHMDTVPVCVGSQPVRKKNIVRSADPRTGLGADDRAGVAVTLHTALRLVREQVPHPPLTFLWTVQEEIGLHGARNVRKSMLGNPKLAFNWDGGAANKMTIGATGGYRLQIEIRGKASHAGNAPEQGISAIAIASLAIADLVHHGWHGDIHQGNQHGTSNIGVIQGGSATNVVTDQVFIRAEARSHDPQFRRKIVSEIEAAFARAVGEIRSSTGETGRVTCQGRLDYESFRLADHEPAVVAAATAIRAAGADPFPAITNGGVDANWMCVHGIPTVTLGCGQMHPHMVMEQLDLAQFQIACDVAWRLATDSQ